jgi:uncharacterized protein (DUF2141 family)
MEDSIKAGESQVINITVNSTDANGQAIVHVNDKNYTVTIKDGKGNLTVDNLTGGNYTVTVIYEGNDNLTGSWTSASFEVEKLDSFVNVDISNSTVGGKQTITVEVPENATGQVLIDVNGQHYYANISGGKATLELDNLPADEYTVDVTYLGDENYAGSSKSVKFNVTRNDSTVNVIPQNVTYGDAEEIIFEVPEDATGNITVVINNKTYTVPVSGGIGSLNITGLDAGNYTVNATYNGDGKYSPSESSATFNVDKKDVDIIVIDKRDRTVAVIVSDNATGSIEIEVDGETYNATIENGQAVVTLTNATPGDKEIKVTYSGDANHNNASITTNMNALKYGAPINVTVEPINVGDTAKIIVELPENATGNVTIEIDGVKYTTDNNCRQSSIRN